MKLSIKVNIDGVVYSSIKTAAKKYGVEPTTVTKRIKSKDVKWVNWNYNDPDHKPRFVMTGIARQQQAVRMTGKPVSDETKQKLAISNGKPIMIDGVKYNSLIGAARLTGIAKSTIWNRLQSDNWVNWFYC